LYTTTIIFSSVGFPYPIPTSHNFIHSEWHDQSSNTSSISRQKMVFFNKFKSRNHQPRVNHTTNMTQQGFLIICQGFKPSSLIPCWGMGWNKTWNKEHNITDNWRMTNIFEDKGWCLNTSLQNLRKENCDQNIILHIGYWSPDHHDKSDPMGLLFVSSISNWFP